jgi:hypothetical protein
MPSTRRHSESLSILQGMGIVVLGLLAILTIANGTFPGFIAPLVLLIVSINSRSTQSDDLDQPFFLDRRSTSTTSVQPQRPDRTHPLWDRWMDG